MSSPILADEELAKQYGRRKEGVALFEPWEWGYRCPKGHRGELITWSEVAKHIWCYKCQLDYPSKECPMQRPSWMKPEEFKHMVAKLPFKPKVLPGVDHYIELLDKAEKKAKEARDDGRKGDTSTVQDD